MTTYTVNWAKTYYCTGTIEIEANSSQLAEGIVQDHIGNYSGHMEYDVDKDFVEAYEARANKVIA